jgi:hypothetical protein
VFPHLSVGACRTSGSWLSSAAWKVALIEPEGWLLESFMRIVQLETLQLGLVCQDCLWLVTSRIFTELEYVSEV